MCGSIYRASQVNAYKLMCFDRNINGNRDDKIFGVGLLVIALTKETYFSTIPNELL